MMLNKKSARRAVRPHPDDTKVVYRIEVWTQVRWEDAAAGDFTDLEEATKHARKALEIHTDGIYRVVKYSGHVIWKTR
jgi:hypothetical protein